MNTFKIDSANFKEDIYCSSSLASESKYRHITQQKNNLGSVVDHLGMMLEFSQVRVTGVFFCSTYSTECTLCLVLVSKDGGHGKHYTR